MMKDDPVEKAWKQTPVTDGHCTRYSPVRLLEKAKEETNIFVA